MSIRFITESQSRLVGDRIVRALLGAAVCILPLAPAAIFFLNAPLIRSQSTAGAAPAYTIQARSGPDFGVIVPVRVNGAGPFWCGVDTGSNHVFRCAPKPPGSSV